MKHNYKFFLASITMLVLHVTMVMGATITYHLHTHVDNRDLTATASVNSGASLENGMPRALWRANTTYKYYSDPELTQEITVAPATDAPVYVDYVFDPPFIVSSEGAEQYYYFNAYISSKKYYLCYDLGAVKAQSAFSSYWKYALWALYGDGYCINLKAKETGQWLTYSSTAPVMADAPMTTGWQLYLSSYTNGGKVYETVVLGTTNNDNQILHYDNNATSPNTPGIDHAMGRFVLANITSTGWSGIGWDNHHKLHNTSSSYSTLFLSNSSFFFAYGTYDNIYTTTWRLLKADGTWIEFTKQKDSDYPRVPFMPRVGNSSTPLWYTDKVYCNYDRYYRDAEFTDKYDESIPDKIPETGNTVVYIKETYKWSQPFVTDHWITLVLPYNVRENEMAEWFGTASDGVSPAVKVLEYYALETNPSNTKYTLKFRVANEIKNHTPYLFKADEVLKGKELSLARSGNWGDMLENNQSTLEQRVVQYEKSWNDQSHTPNSPYVTMIGTYYNKELTTPSNGNHPNKLYFYFGYDKRYDPAAVDDYVGDEAAAGKLPYNFYRVTSKNVYIQPYRCYFYIEDAGGASVEGAKFMLMDNFGNEITSVEGIDADSFIQTTGRIYNLNGQMMGTDLQSLPRGIYIVNGKKVMK